MKITAHRPEQPVEVVIEFKNAQELKDLLEELQTWKPSGGWTQLASEFFEELRETLDED